jgi:hypothetical protein
MIAKIVGVGFRVIHSNSWGSALSSKAALLLLYQSESS